MSRPKEIRRLFRLRQRDDWAEQTVDLEILHHLEMRIDELMDEGLSEQKARQTAEAAFGNVSRYRSECVRLTRGGARKMRWLEKVTSALGDVVHALRGMQRSPGFALAVVLTLGLGIGASAAGFTVVDAVLLRPIAYDRQVNLRVPRNNEIQGAEQMFESLLPNEPANNY